MKCQNSTTSTVVCKNTSTIDSHFNDEVFSFAFVNTMFALEDYVAPLQKFIDDSLYFNIDPSKSKRANFFVQESK